MNIVGGWIRLVAKRARLSSGPRYCLLVRLVLLTSRQQVGCYVPNGFLGVRGFTKPGSVAVRVDPPLVLLLNLVPFFYFIVALATPSIVLGNHFIKIIPWSNNMTIGHFLFYLATGLPRVKMRGDEVLNFCYD